jgi:hypothetical protein
VNTAAIETLIFFNAEKKNMNPIKPINPPNPISRKNC